LLQSAAELQGLFGQSVSAKTMPSPGPAQQERLIEQRQHRARQASLSGTAVSSSPWQRRCKYRTHC
jgi:hypothetical protein